jgi:transcriptional regulator with XRE-family HTH domain
MFLPLKARTEVPKNAAERLVDPLTEPYWRPSGKTVSKAGIEGFSKRLHHLMVERGLTQADLARAVFGLDDSGKIKGRDKISLYLRAAGLPGEPHMRKLADTLHVSLVDLAPQIDTLPLERTATRARAPRPNPKQSISADFGHVELRADGEVMLSMLLPMELARRVMEYARHKLPEYKNARRAEANT